MTIETERTNMITQQLRTGGVLDETILSLYENIPRQLFVPSHLQHFAYSDMQLDLPHQQKMMTPLEEALLLQALNLQGTETILEIGTGSGFLTTLLSRLAKKVISLDCFQTFTTDAEKHLARHHCDNVELITMDASRGFFDKAPYNVVIISCGLKTMCETYSLQVSPGGKLFALMGEYPIMQAQLHHLSHDKTWRFEMLYETYLPPLIGPKPNSFTF